MKALFGIGLVVLVLGILSFFVPVPHAEHHGVSAGDVHLGVTTHDDQIGFLLLLARFCWCRGLA